MTSKILFKDVIVALREHGFVMNSYPLILSFEMHCGLKGQKRISEILKEEIADMIFAVPEDHEGHHYYAPPSALMNKFIIKCRGKLTLNENVYCNEFSERLVKIHDSNLKKMQNGVGSVLTKTMKEIIKGSGYASIFKAQLEKEKEEDPPLDLSDDNIKILGVPLFLRKAVEENININERIFKLKQGKNVLDDSDPEKSDSEGSDLGESDKKNRKQKKKVLPELNIFYGLIGRKINLKGSSSVWEIASLNENKIKTFYKNKRREIIEYHRKYLTRIYPAGSRVDSSNYSPIIGWATGSQIVALNFQSNDEFMLINYAKFRANGGNKCGYVLKPYYMLHDYQGRDHPYFAEGEKKPIKRVTIEVISGQALGSLEFHNKKSTNTYVEVKVRGLGDEKCNPVQKTHTFNGNAFHPVWASAEKPCKFKFNIATPDFCTFVFTAFSEDLLGRNRLGWYAIEFNNMQQGYRVVPLLTPDLRTIKHSYIFCHITIEDL